MIDAAPLGAAEHEVVMRYEDASQSGSSNSENPDRAR